MAKKVNYAPDNKATCKHCGASENFHGDYTDSDGKERTTQKFEAGTYLPRTKATQHWYGLDVVFKGLKDECPYCRHQELAKAEVAQINKVEEKVETNA